MPEEVRQHLEALLRALQAALPALQPVTQPGPGSSSQLTGAAEPAAPLAQAEYHLSLSRTVALRYRQIDSLLDVLRDCLR